MMEIKGLRSQEQAPRAVQAFNTNKAYSSQTKIFNTYKKPQAAYLAASRPTALDSAISIGERHAM
jgi:hypothetical protein